MQSADYNASNWTGYEADCHGCDIYGRVNEDGLCPDCAQKLERDLIRERDWNYTFSGYTLGDQGREELRKKVIAQYGQSLELIAGDPAPPRKQRRRRRNRRKSGRK